ncbi:cartilage-associated protein-like [Anopheles funestus]|uniref:cartilage-associated protein-like n=1 Tax=Anopheles funestus TaxID=62324 RepID=UPI0020C68CD3|nr:cartilage-associated protein-like [Anopheles funestus]XP_049277527.1 cartilage-associated protein-like [Anopheles funestus]XP_049277528.1 cartilage-associated protein-like [Anopheles funestus]XP_049277529.1 cartilage-associated protein-like [Anopheles funestus]XP_049277530.1 cartilage-associated protein-like [Anopheles funestus]XP_049277531.1 cartilage-associated protein-like [Anopheles funestus]
MIDVEGVEMISSTRRWHRPLLVIGWCCLFTLTVAQTTNQAATSAASTESTTETEHPNYISDTPEDGSSFIDQYEQGVQAYLSNEWEDCVYFLERALEGYRTYYESVANCRMECEYAARDVKHRGDFLHSSNIDNLQHYELILRRTLCLSKCARKYAIYRYLPFSEDFDGHYMDIFHEQKVYPYLYACYVKSNRVTLAASAAYTFMVKHPSDTVMKKNFEEAIEMPGVDRDEIHDLEEKKFVPLLIGGIVDEQETNWERAIERLESSIKQYIFDENECRAFCEGEFDHGFLPDFITAIGNHFTNALYCKRNCTSNMGMVRGKYYENLFPRHYQHLQKAYYHVKQYEESYRAGMSYLLFHVDDLQMPEALKTIETEAKGSVTANFFKPRREAVEYNERMQYEEKLAHFIKQEFDLLEDGGSESDLDREYEEDVQEDEAFIAEEYEMETNEESQEDTQPQEDVSNELYPKETIGYNDHDEL